MNRSQDYITVHTVYVLLSSASAVCLYVL